MISTDNTLKRKSGEDSIYEFWQLGYKFLFCQVNFPFSFKDYCIINGPTEYIKLMDFIFHLK